MKRTVIVLALGFAFVSCVESAPNDTDLNSAKGASDVDKADPQCLNKADGAACDDGNPCTESDTCQEYACTGAPVQDFPLCNSDDNVCTIEFCSPNTGQCEFANEVNVCVAENADPCMSWQCDATAGCVVVEVYDYVPCDDGDACTAEDMCEKQSPFLSCCKGTGLPEIDDYNACTADSCVDGVIEHTPIPDGGACVAVGVCPDDGMCQGGDCVATSASECNDGLECTADVCDPETGACTHVLYSDACLIDGECYFAGDTKPALPCFKCDPYEDQFDWFLTCDDRNACTADSCLPDGTCVYEPTNEGEPCDDESECTNPDTCTEGVCTGPGADCDDGDPCTGDPCFPDLGCFHYTKQEGEPCDDGSSCTLDDTCVMAVCTGTPTACDDGNPCTADTCDLALGCVHTPTGNGQPCDDGDACTTGDFCSNGTCESTGSMSCDDGKACTSDSCDPAAGCVFGPVLDGTECDDGNACTKGDLCLSGDCSGAAPTVCDDGNPCTEDGCDSDIGCTIAPTNNGGPCDDGNECTTGELCFGGECGGAIPVECNDGNVCTDDSCANGTGCIFLPNGAACDDGDACTTSDGCVGASCFGKLSVDCDDGEPCTEDVCNADSGCQNLPFSGECDDENPCTEQDMCVEGSCTGIKATDCNDWNGCTADGCDPASGCVHTPANDGQPCDDVNVCLWNDLCEAGVCTGEFILDCDDGNPCTMDSCEPMEGCLNVPLGDGTACDDGNSCTLGDTCIANGCQPGEVIACDDNNPCTQDECDPTGGCGHSSLLDGTACDDGDACTGVCGFKEKYLVGDPHPLYPAWSFKGFGSYGPEHLVFFSPSAETFFEIFPGGTALLQGPLIPKSGLSMEDASRTWLITCQLTKRAGPGSGGAFIQEPFQIAFKNQWTYWDIVPGTCQMKTEDGFYHIDFTEKPAPGVFPLQLGPAASAFAEGLGYSNWVNYTMTQNGAVYTDDSDFHAKLTLVDSCDGGDQCTAGVCQGGNPVPACAP